MSKIISKQDKIIGFQIETLCMSWTCNWTETEF
jgi:hypothetical protein